MSSRSRAMTVGAVYTLLTVWAGAGLAMDAGHDGPRILLRLPFSPLTLGWGTLPGYIAGALFVIGLFFWSYVGSLLSRPHGGWALAIALGSHYLGVAALLLTDQAELAELVRQPGVELLFGIPYVLGQVLLWVYLLGRRPARKYAA